MKSGGREAESLPVDCDEESAKKIGIDVVDQRIPVDELWLAGGEERWRSRPPLKELHR